MKNQLLKMNIQAFLQILLSCFAPQNFRLIMLFSKLEVNRTSITCLNKRKKDTDKSQKDNLNCKECSLKKDIN